MNGVQCPAVRQPIGLRTTAPHCEENAQWRIALTESLRRDESDGFRCSSRESHAGTPQVPLRGNRPAFASRRSVSFALLQGINQSRFGRLGIKAWKPNCWIGSSLDSAQCRVEPLPTESGLSSRIRSGANCRRLQCLRRVLALPCRQLATLRRAPA